MSKNIKSIDDMLDYVHQLRKHTEDRRAIHIKLSALEKHFREEHYRLFVAKALRPLITNFGAVMFALPNADVVLVVKDAPIDTIDPLLSNIRKKYRDSSLVASLDVVQGVSDAFVQWFDLETDYSDFKDYILALAADLKNRHENEPESAEVSADRKKTPGMLELQNRSPERLKPSPNVRLVALEKEPVEIEKRGLDIDLAHTISNALKSVDVAGLVRKQQVMAILGDHDPLPVMVHRLVPLQVAFDALLKGEIIPTDDWLIGYLERFLATRLLAAEPDISNEEDAIASSLLVSCESVCSEVFDRFDKSLGNWKRSSIIIEFAIMDVMANFAHYLRAHDKLDKLGYKVSVAGIDPRTLLWMDYVSLDTDFVKIQKPEGEQKNWLSYALEQQLRQCVHRIGYARIILSGCEKKEDIALGQRLGITLFQGDAVDPLSASTE